MTLPARPSPSQSWIPWIVLIAALWAQVFYGASYGWIHALYYDYGWYVPPLAIWFFYRKWRGWETVRRPRLSGWMIAAGMLLLTAVLTFTRTLLRVDQGWPSPLWIQSGVACAVTLAVVWRMAGKAAVPGVVPVLIFALTAVRLPTAIETPLVNGLTHGVLDASSWIFRMTGSPVMVLGNQLELMGQVVEVSEGCSGIRSSQSFLMASLCFGEWLGLGARPRVLMVAIALATAWVTNVARACVLAQIRFTQGEPAFERAHDSVGMAAFVVGTGILLWVAVRIDGKRKNRRVVRQQVEIRSV